MTLPGISGSQAAELLELCSVTGADRADCLLLLASGPGAGVRRAVELLSERLGQVNDEPAPADPGISELDWLTALLRFAPILARHHAELGMEAAVTAATLADIGWQMAIHRRVHERFGLETWAWLTHHLDGSLVRLGRLQFHLQQASGTHGPLPAGAWFLATHIPEGGPLETERVQQSLAWAASFFARHFPDRIISAACCDSWLLDPYLTDALPGSNMAAFARRFDLDALRAEPENAIYFTFRTRDMNRIPTLPRETSLQQAVLERIDAGGVWQVGTGWMSWPATPSF